MKWHKGGIDMRINVIIALMVVLLTVSVATALPITVDSVELDDISLSQNALNRVAIERGDQYEVEVRFTPWLDLDDVEIEAFLTGYEYNDVDRISDTIGVFSADANVTYVKRLQITFPDDIEEDAYKLRIIISDRDNPETVMSYNLKMDVPRHAMSIEDVILSSGDTVKAGGALLASVRVENKGEKDQDDVRVSISIPQLGITAVDYIEEVENGDEEEETEELFLRIPRCTKAGTYDAIIDVYYSENHRKASAKKEIHVLADETCGTEEAKTSITLGSNLQEVMPGQVAVFPVTIANTGNDKTFSLVPQQVGWADVSISPMSTFIAKENTPKTIFVNVKAKEDAPPGTHTLTVAVQTGNNREELSMSVNVAEVEEEKPSGFFEISLLVLLVILIIVVIGIGISKMRDKEQTEYY